ncbi:hypothetical protein TWF569_011829 [Orbilia oligospora]|uniref:Uncharacterized protein n=1 Tax=Orbilia oligospora TaxID=2813651 RepID=A0A4Z0XVA7_ORBOL|nr:hypothetical protein TWF706_001994 [Orbilia oligospora]KAF3092310.1 hypothetical protein TWF103_011281 [Orbilia oligospora]KAF3099489.1 hypothetical protein TWF102_005465 [Orbilia oligospora]KAF3125776.1 hypothetical protein TWF594_001337 [Orbilia oligospora]KAF3127211.1 hypothetical protein TWF569_011829 [Orbilia oligospora]
MCIQDFTLYHCGCQTKGSLRVCGETQCSHIKDIAKQLPDHCESCQAKLEEGIELPRRRTSTIKKIKRTLSLRTAKSPEYSRGHQSRKGSISMRMTPEDDGWVNPFNDPL